MKRHSPAPRPLRIRHMSDAEFERRLFARLRGLPFNAELNLKSLLKTIDQPAPTNRANKTKESQL